jgi:hypothetical protein
LENENFGEKKVAEILDFCGKNEKIDVKILAEKFLIEKKLRKIRKIIF